jgi:hypothetical protein
VAHPGGDASAHIGNPDGTIKKSIPCLLVDSEFSNQFAGCSILQSCLSTDVARAIMAMSDDIDLTFNRLTAILANDGILGLGTAIIPLILGALMPLRVSGEEEEERGLNFVFNGGEAYDPMTKLRPSIP